MNHADCEPGDPCALQHAFDVATVETIQRSNVSTKNSLVKMKSSSISLRKTGWLHRIPEHGRRGWKHIIKWVYGLNIESRTRDLTDHNLILLIISCILLTADENRCTNWGKFCVRVTWEYKICIFNSLSPFLLFYSMIKTWKYILFHILFPKIIFQVIEFRPNLILTADACA